MIKIPCTTTQNQRYEITFHRGFRLHRWYTIPSLVESHIFDFYVIFFLFLPFLFFFLFFYIFKSSDHYYDMTYFGLARELDVLLLLCLLVKVSLPPNKYIWILKLTRPLGADIAFTYVKGIEEPDMRETTELLNKEGVKVTFYTEFKIFP